MKKKEINEQNQEEELSTENLNTMYRPKRSKKQIEEDLKLFKKLGILDNGN